MGKASELSPTPSPSLSSHSFGSLGNASLESGTPSPSVSVATNSVIVNVVLDHTSPLFPPFLLAFIIAKFTVTSPLPVAGGVQVNVQLVPLLPECVALLPLICMLDPALERVPLLTCKEKPPPEPEPPVKPIVMLYPELEGSYSAGKFSVAEIDELAPP